MRSQNSCFETTKSRQEAIQIEVLNTNGTNTTLARNLSDTAHSHASQFFAEMGQTGIACKKGCSYCCHQPVTVFPFEAIRIADALRSSLAPAELESLAETMKLRVKDFKDSSVRKNVNNKTACPLLSNNQCSVYDNRPLTCRLAHSFSVKQCRLSFQKDRLKVQIPVSLELGAGISGIIEGVFEQLPQKNLDGNLYELCSAVLVALSNSDAASKWARGDFSVFSECIKDDTGPV